VCDKDLSTYVREERAQEEKAEEVGCVSEGWEGRWGLGEREGRAQLHVKVGKDSTQSHSTAGLVEVGCPSHKLASVMPDRKQRHGHTAFAHQVNQARVCFLCVTRTCPLT